MAAEYEKENDLALIDAVEALSSIAELEQGQDVAVSETQKVYIHNFPVIYQTVHWLKGDDFTQAVNLAKRVFCSVLTYLQKFYSEKYSYVTDQTAAESIKAIMVLVGEGAKKLDKYKELFASFNKESIKELKEYQRLEEFYLRKIAHRIDEGLIGRWILALSQRTLARPVFNLVQERPQVETKHIFVDLDAVKKDTEYELLFIRKEDGSRFFSPRLIRNMKLVSDVGSYFDHEAEKELLDHLVFWQDAWIQKISDAILKKQREAINRFFFESQNTKHDSLKDLLDKASFALMLASNPSNSLHDSEIKSCREYFHDFQTYLRQALQTNEYQSMILRSSEKPKELEKTMIELIQGFCLSLFEIREKGIAVLKIENLLEQASSINDGKANEPLSFLNRIKKQYLDLQLLFKNHKNGPLNKILNMFDEGNLIGFDPLLQFNIPWEQYVLNNQGNPSVNIRMPAPIYQEFIHKPLIIEEFKGYLLAMKNQGKRKHLFINLQDRTSWKEYPRAHVIEQLQYEFPDQLVVATLAKHTDFYHQMAPYHQENHADIFMDQFKKQLEDELCGCFFPQGIKEKLFSGYVEQLMNDVHAEFFNKRNVLTRNQRLDFIEIVYLFLEIKLLEIVRPSSFSITCKDGIDIGQAASAELFIFAKAINNEAFSPEDLQTLNLMLYAPAILIRERLIFSDCLNRILSALKVVFEARAYHP